MILAKPMRKPLCVDLFAGLGGWTEGFLSEGWTCIGFDIERHVYGNQRYPAQLVLQDVLTLHGSQFRDADCIVASPPCQEFSYMAMPWSRAKQIAAALQGKGEFPEGYTGSRRVADLTALFDGCFRIQREACEAATMAYGCTRCGVYHPATKLDGCEFTPRYVPMVVENVKGAQRWVGKAKANFGSFYFWGDVAMVGGRVVAGRLQFGDFTRAAKRGGKVDGFNFHQFKNAGQPGGSFQSAAVKEFGFGRGHDWRQDPIARFNSKPSARKAASAQIAKIPYALSSYIARALQPASTYLPRPDLETRPVLPNASDLG